MDNLLFLQYFQHTDKKTRTVTSIWLLAAPKRRPFFCFALYFTTNSASKTFSDDVMLQPRWRFFLSIVYSLEIASVYANTV